MLEKLMNNPLAWLVLSTLSIFSVFFGIYTWLKGRSKKEFSYSYVSQSIVRGGKKLNPAIRFTYNGIEVNNLTSTRFAIWNSGNQVINASDMVKEKDLTIVVDDEAEILSVEIVGQTDETNKFQLSGMTETTQELKFEYVDKREGVVLQVFHTGFNDDLSMTCKIKGGKPARNTNKALKKRIKFLKLDSQKTVAVFAASLAGYLTLFSLIMIVALWIPELYNFIYSVRATNSDSNVIVTIICSIATLFCDVFSAKMLKQAFQFSVPYALRKYM